MKNISAIILAGGKSSRMKFNKEYIQMDGSYLVHNQIKELQKYFNEIIVVSNNPEHYSDFNVDVVSDILVGNTPIIGLHAGLVNSSNTYNYCIACDMPFINMEYIKYMESLINNSDAYVSKYNNYIEPFNAIYNSSIVNQIEEFISTGNYGFQKMIMLLDTFYITEKTVSFYQQETDMFKNINNESELYKNYNNIASSYRILDVEKIIDGESFLVSDKVITEYTLNIYINDQYYSTMMITPDDIEFLVIGSLHSELIIKDINEITDFSLDLDNHRCDVLLSHQVNRKNFDRLNILSSACGGSSKPQIDESKLPKVSNEKIFDVNRIFDEVSVFNKESILFKETGGVHSVQLNYGNKKVLFEDIGRHNAVDKIVGFILKNKIIQDDIYIITSGRISSDILLKSALINVALVVSRSAPTSLAVKLADKLGVTIIGFTRGRKLNIYTHSNKIKK